MKNRHYFTKHLIIQVLPLFLILGWCHSLNAQEFLTGVKNNTHILKESIQYQNNNHKNRLDAEAVKLPFFEDFSNYTGYPNENLFEDRQAYVNQTFPAFPPSIGVVTLDALDESGVIYPHLTTVPKGADTLTSRCIRLDSLFLEEEVKQITLADSLYFSFYFQPGGVGVAGDPYSYGNQPNINDSLVLEFGYIIEEDTTFTMVWDHIWSTPGLNVSEWLAQNQYQYFKQVMIPIIDEKYLSNSFRFRFRNYASLEPQTGITGWEGNVDQWHIDYIRLSVSRSYNDLYTNDVVFMSPTTSFLENYQAMPWKQFHPSDMASHFTNQLANISGGTRTAHYSYNISRNGNIISQKSTGAIDINSFFTNGLQQNPEQATPAISTNGFSTLSDTATFKVSHLFQNSAGADYCSANDTCIYIQKFYDYYAYDDGTAEYGYVLNNQYNVAYLAMKFPIRVKDSLRGVQMWFNHTKNDENLEASFNIIVWNNENGKPGKKLYTLEGNRPKFEGQFLDFVEYTFDNKILVSDTIWVGFEQMGNVQLNIGFDQNNDSREFFRYNTSGNWEISSFRGTPMIRPVFGEKLKLSSIHIPKNTISVYPNPTTGELRVTGYELQVTGIEVFDIFGRNLTPLTSYLTPHTSIDISNLPRGVYIIKIYNTNNSFETFKIIKN